MTEIVENYLTYLFILTMANVKLLSFEEDALNFYFAAFMEGRYK